MNFAEDDALIDAQIEAIKYNTKIPDKEKNEKVATLKNSKLLCGTDSSTKTVFNIANTMIGSTVIVFPILFIKDGLVGSVIIMFVIGCIQYLTCRLLVLHNRQDELDFNSSILRIGGRKLNIFNSILNLLLLFLVCIIYYQLIVANFY
jgi:sodium-coupled neutral amino acid transporter 9